MNIKMKKDAKGAPNGVTAFDYKEGMTYPNEDEGSPPMSDDLAKAFVEADWAEDLDSPKLEKKVVKPELKQGDPVK